MRESIGSTWIFQLVIIFILIFVSFLILSLTYSKSYKTKNEILNIIEKAEGVNENSIAIINNYLLQTGYSFTHACPYGDTVAEKNWVGCADLNKAILEPARSGKKYYYCIRKHKNSCNAKNKNTLQTMYYELRIFFKFNVPVLQSIGTFTTDGNSGEIFINRDYFDANKFGVINNECNSK